MGIATFMEKLLLAALLCVCAFAEVQQGMVHDLAVWNTKSQAEPIKAAAVDAKAAVAAAVVEAAAAKAVVESAEDIELRKQVTSEARALEKKMFVKHHKAFTASTEAEAREMQKTENITKHVQAQARARMIEIQQGAQEKVDQIVKNVDTEVATEAEQRMVQKAIGGRVLANQGKMREHLKELKSRVGQLESLSNSVAETQQHMSQEQLASVTAKERSLKVNFKGVEQVAAKLQAAEAAAENAEPVVEAAADAGADVSAVAAVATEAATEIAEPVAEATEAATETAEPVAVATEAATKTAELDVGQRVEARYKGKKTYYAGKIAARDGGKYDIAYDDGEKESGVLRNLIRADASAVAAEATQAATETAEPMAVATEAAADATATETAAEVTDLSPVAATN